LVVYAQAAAVWAGRYTGRCRVSIYKNPMAVSVK